MARLMITAFAAFVVAASAVGGFALGKDGAPSSQGVEAAQSVARAEAMKSARGEAAEEARRSAISKGVRVRRREGVQAGRRAGDKRGEVAAAKESAELAAAAEASRLADAADSAYEDDGGAYDPSPPPAGFYPDFEAFCADQPEETECGGPGDPASG